MIPEEFDTSGWIERVAAALDGRDETPFPLDDVRDLYVFLGGKHAA